MIRPKQGADCSDSFEGLDFGFGRLVLLAGSINTTLGAARFIAGSWPISFPVETEPFAACSMREATAPGCEM